jgi:hypothetical protein
LINEGARAQEATIRITATTDLLRVTRSELGEGEVVGVAEDDVGMRGEPVLSPKNIASVLLEDDEPCIENLLAAEPAHSAPRDGSWGARAWEEFDSGVTMRHIEQHDTAFPRRDACSGSGADMGSSWHIRVTANREDPPRLARHTVAYLHGTPRYDTCARACRRQCSRRCAC